MHKYSFAEQLLIHSQNPNATVCATMDFWKVTRLEIKKFLWECAIEKLNNKNKEIKQNLTNKVK